MTRLAEDGDTRHSVWWVERSAYRRHRWHPRLVEPVAEPDFRFFPSSTRTFQEIRDAVITGAGMFDFPVDDDDEDLDGLLDS